MVSKRSGPTPVAGGAANKELAEPPQVTALRHRVSMSAMDKSRDDRGACRQGHGRNAWQGGILAILLIFLFLRNWRPTLTIGIAIPLSIVMTFIAFYLPATP